MPSKTTARKRTTLRVPRPKPPQTVIQFFGDQSRALEVYDVLKQHRVFKALHRTAPGTVKFEFVRHAGPLVVHVTRHTEDTLWGFHFADADVQRIAAFISIHRS